MNQYKKIILSGTLMGAVAFAPLAFAADIANTPTQTPTGTTQQMPVKVKHNKKKVENKKASVGAITNTNVKNDKESAEAPGTVEKTENEKSGATKDSMKVIDFAKAKDKFTKEITALTAKQSGLSTALDAQASAGKDVTLAKSNLALAQAKLADASAAGNSIADKVTLSAAKKLLEEAKTLTGKVMGKAKSKEMKNGKKEGDHKKAPIKGTTTTPPTTGSTN